MNPVREKEGIRADSQGDSEIPGAGVSREILIMNLSDGDASRRSVRAARAAAAAEEDAEIVGQGVRRTERDNR